LSRDFILIGQPLKLLDIVTVLFVGSIYGSHANTVLVSCILNTLN